MTAAIPSGWPVPGGVARPAPFAAPEEHFDAIVEVAVLRTAASILERWRAGWHEPTPQAARVARLLATRQLPLEPARWRAEAAARAGVLARRLASGDWPPLAAAFAAWGLDDVDRDVVGALLAFELSPLAAVLMRHAGEPADPDDAPLRIAGLAAGLATPSPAIALDRVAARLAPLALAAIGDDESGAATRWRVRAARRWLALVAGRCGVDDRADLRAIPPDPADPLGRSSAVRAAVARRAAGAPMIRCDAPPGALAAALAADRRTALLAGPLASPPVIAREARLLDAGVIVHVTAPPADLPALVAHPITVTLTDHPPAGAHVASVR